MLSADRRLNDHLFDVAGFPEKRSFPFKSRLVSDVSLFQVDPIGYKFAELLYRRQSARAYGTHANFANVWFLEVDPLYA